MLNQIYNELRVIGPAGELARFKALATAAAGGEAFSFVRLVSVWAGQNSSMDGETQALCEDLGARPVEEVATGSEIAEDNETSALYTFGSGPALPVACVRAASELFPDLAFLLYFENAPYSMRGAQVINDGEVLESVVGEFGAAGREAYDQIAPLPDIFAPHEGRAPSQRPLCYTTFNESRFLVAMTTYRAGGTPALLLHRSQFEYLDASVNLPGAPLDEDEVFVRDTEQNEGALAALVAAGVVEDTGRTVPSGFIQIHVCRLKGRALEEYRALAPDAPAQRVARVILEQCTSCGTMYQFLATAGQEARYYASPRTDLIQRIFPVMHNLARGVLSQGNMCALCLTPTDEAFDVLAPHMFDVGAATFYRGGRPRMLVHTRYLSDGRAALAFALEEPGLLTAVTVNLPGVEAEGDEVFIVEAGGTAGLRAELAAQLVIEDEGTPVGDDHPDTYRCKLTSWPPPPPSDPAAVVRGEEAEAREGFVPGSHRRFRYVEGGDATTPALRSGDAVFELVAVFEENAPGARALLAGESPTTADPVPVHAVFRRRRDGKHFVQTSLWSGGTEQTPREAREVSAARRPRPRVPHDEGLARRLASEAFTASFISLADGLDVEEGERLIFVAEGYELAEVAAFHASPPAENPEGLASRLLYAGAVTHVLTSGDELQTYDGHRTTDCDVASEAPYRAVRAGRFVVARPAREGETGGES